MTRSQLAQIASHLSRYRKIDLAERVDDTIVKIVFDRKHDYYFDMRRGGAYIFRTEHYRKVRNYNAPFDVVLRKRFNNARIERIEVPEGNRILRIVVSAVSSYKAQKSVLQFEFTGRNTNIIILDENETILEAYRHIDADKSFREVKVGIRLAKLPPKNFPDRKEEPIEDIDIWLYEAYRQQETKKIESVRAQKRKEVAKKIARLQKAYDALEEESKLEAQSDALMEEANLLLANLHRMQNYQKELTVTDFEGKTRTIRLPQETRTPAEAANLLFKRAKKLRQKARYTYIERENLLSKIAFLRHLDQAIASAKTLDALQLYLPKQLRQQKKSTKEDTNIETFFIEGYKIMVGKNEKGNIALLKSARMNDIWMHLKDIPSTHVIIRTEKKSPPEEVLAFGAKLCVQFSDVQPGSYLVDFTRRRNVKMREGAHVNYVDYDTIKATKE